jgi:hypothetical protein
MAQKDKVLDILALATLPEDVKIARLAHKWIGASLPREQAKAIIRTFIGGNGRLPELTQALLDEKHRQEKIRNERKAFADAAEKRRQSPMLKYKASVVGRRKAERNRKRRLMQAAQRTFGPAVRENFNEDTLALMSLISGEDRWYKIEWMEAGSKPVRCALIEVITMTPKGHLSSRFLLYKINGRFLVARTLGRDLQRAWGSQLPKELVAAADTLIATGWNFRSDLEAQEMVVTSPSGEERRVPWTGRTVDD